MTRRYKHTIQPWESTEEIFTEGAHELGLSRDLTFEPVLGSLPERTIAIILIYPTPSHYEEQKKNERADSARQSETQATQACDVVWLSQEVQNACGPYALLHAVLNSDGRLHLRELDPSTSRKISLMTCMQTMAQYSTGFSRAF